MKTVFADTSYWTAIVMPKDQWAQAAARAKSSLGEARTVTTDEVLGELLAALSRSGEALRKKAAEMVRAILDNPNVKVIPQSRASFLKGLALYEKRADKEYSLTDCICMTVMNAESLTEVLTNDRHFEQEGFVVLMRAQPSV